jgi:peroxiredoxin
MKARVRGQFALRHRSCHVALLLLIGAISLFALCLRLTAETPNVGEKAPDFSLSTPEGHAIRLSDLTASGKVVLVVLRGYPGYQCPYCQRQVHDFVTNAASFAATGAQVLLVYPGEPGRLDEHAREFLSTQTKLPPNTHLVIDPDYTFTHQYGLRWDAPQETAYPATFILDATRIILYRKISRSHGDRTTAGDILAELKKAK